MNFLVRIQFFIMRLFYLDMVYIWENKIYDISVSVILVFLLELGQMNAQLLNKIPNKKLCSFRIQKIVLT